MKKFLLTILGISAVIISLSIAYYFIVFLPKKEKEKIEQGNLKLELEKQQIELTKQQFEYQKTEDTQIKKYQQLKEIQDNIKENQKTAQENWNRARAECIAIADKNSQSFMEALDGCQTTECQNNLINNKDIQYFGGAFIESCTENRL